MLRPQNSLLTARWRRLEKRWHRLTRRGFSPLFTQRTRPAATTADANFSPFLDSEDAGTAPFGHHG